MMISQSTSNWNTWLTKVANNDVLLFLVIVLVLNIDRLVLGEYGLLRRIDLSEQYVNKTMVLAKYLLSPSAYAWDASILRGWPTAVGSLGPQYFGSLIATILPIKLVYPIIHITTDYLIIFGAFLFLKGFLGYQRDSALFGSFLFLGINYWYTENLIVVAAPLLPMLVAVTADGKEKINTAIRFISMGCIATLSFPPLVLPLMPLAHVVVVLIYSDREKVARNFFYVLVFWAIYSILHGPSIWGYWQNWEISNRALWGIGDRTGSLLEAFTNSFTAKSTLFPVLLVFALVGRQTIERIIIPIGIIFLIIILSSFQESSYFDQMIRIFPIIKKFSFIYTRIHNFVGLILFIIAALLVDYQFRHRTEITFSFILKGSAIFIVTTLVVFLVDGIKTTAVFASCSFIILCAMWFYRDRRFIGGAAFWLTFLIILVPFRFAYTVDREYFYQGNLFLDPFKYESQMKAFRVATVMEEPWQHDFFPAQVSIKGLETFGGSAVFYNGTDAILWSNYVTDGGASWAAQTFTDWNNRAELIRDDFEANLDRVIRYMRLNNVLFVRSLQPITHTYLELVNAKLVNRDTLGTVFVGKEPDFKKYFLYRLRNPISRVFSVPVEQSFCCLETYDRNSNESTGKKYDLTLLTEKTTNINLDQYKPGEIEFQNTSNGERNILVSTNYSNQWRLYIDNNLKQENLHAGPLDMIRVKPIVGSHSYKLIYTDNMFKQLLGAIIIAMFLFVVFSVFLNRR
jgi:hypothetical protein